MKQWLKMTLVGDPALCDPLADFVMGVLEGVVEIEADDDNPAGVLHFFFEKENPSQQEIDELAARIKGYAEELLPLFSADMPTLSWELFEDDDWGKAWKKYFIPFFITPDVVIAPTWETYTPQGDEKVITMDPGMAFGTGHHATTSLALEMVAQEVRAAGKGCRVLDVGTGTGVLGIAAALFGAASVYGIDNDPIAVQVAGENAALNNVADVMKTGIEAVSVVEGQFPLVVANIVHDVLVGMAAHLACRTALGGRLILSGILVGDQVVSIRRTFEAAGFSFVMEKSRDEWAALLFQK